MGITEIINNVCNNMDLTSDEFYVNFMSKCTYVVQSFEFIALPLLKNNHFSTTYIFKETRSQTVAV